jgi:hypothetical protein
MTGQDLKAEICLGNNGSQIIRGPVSTAVVGLDTQTTSWTVNPTAGSKILVGIAHNSAETITSVIDNGVTAATFILDSTSVNGTEQFDVYRADNITAPASGSYAVTLTASGAHTNELQGIAYTGVRAGPPTAVNTGTGTSGAVTTNSVTPALAGALYFAGFSTNSGAAAETITLTASGFTGYVITNAGVANSRTSSLADKIDTAGPSATAATWTLSDAPVWAAAIAVYDAAWVDISTYVYQRDTVTVQRGRPNEASTMTPASATLTLDNRTARFTTRNPAGAYYPNLVQNTPLRLSVPVADGGLSNYLRFEGDTTSSATTPDSAGLQIAGVLDVRVDLWPSDYSGNVLAAKWGATAKSWAFLLNGAVTPALAAPGAPRDISTQGTGTLGFYWWDGASQHMLDSGLPVPYFGQRICLRVLFTPATGTAQFFTAPTMAGSFTQLGASQVFGATVLANGAGQAVQAGGSLTLNVQSPTGAYPHTFGSALGMVYEAKILAAAVVKADPVFSSQTAGVASFTDAQSNTWTMNGTSEISGRLHRFHGEMGSFPKAADPTATDVYSQAAAYGISRRLQNSNTPLQSPMRRAYVRLPANLNLAAYWPGEDGSGATSIGSATGGTPMGISGTPTLASSTAFACSSPLPVMNGARFFAGSIATPAGFTWTDNVVRFLLNVPAADDTNNAVICQFTTTGAIATVVVTYTTGGHLSITGFNAAGAQIFTGGPSIFNPSLLGGTVRVSAELLGSGTWQLIVLSTAHTPSGGPSGAFAGAVGAVTSVSFGGGLVSSAMGHFSVQGVTDTIQDVLGPLTAWNGETAATRFSRLCGEEGIACRITGPPAASMPMGNQPIDTLFSILQQCENTDLGMMFEPRQALGLGYRTRTSMYHQAPLATVSYSSAQLYQGFSSTSDTQLAVNDVTATSTSGATARSFGATGSMSVLAPPAGIGRVDTSISPAPQNDPAVAQIASWYLSVRSVDDDRYPAVPLQMPRTETPSAVALLDAGDYLKITGTPSWLPPPPVSQLCAGFAETWFPAALWELDVNGIPELPYETAQFGTAHWETAGSQLTSAITSGATSFKVTTTTGPVWTQTAGDFPFDIVIDREQMTVSNITSATSPQTFTVTRAVNGVALAHSSFAAVTLYHKHTVAL